MLLTLHQNNLAAGGAFTPSITEAASLADIASNVASFGAAANESLPLARPIILIGKVLQKTRDHGF